MEKNTEGTPTPTMGLKPAPAKTEQEPEPGKPSFPHCLARLVELEKRALEAASKRIELVMPFMDRRDAIQKLANGLRIEEEALENDTNVVTKAIDDEMEGLHRELERTREQLGECWDEQAKTQELNGWRVSRRDLKRLEIESKPALVAQLTACHRIETAIKYFDMKLLLQLSELGFLTRAAVRPYLQKSITAKQIPRIGDIA